MSSFCVFILLLCHKLYFFFFFNDTATTEIYTLSLHDALPICQLDERFPRVPVRYVIYSHSHWDHIEGGGVFADTAKFVGDRKSTRLNSSHLVISYAVFCLKKKNTILKVLFISERHLVTRRDSP